MMRRLIWLLGLLSVAAIVALVVYNRSLSSLSRIGGQPEGDSPPSGRRVSPFAPAKNSQSPKRLPGPVSSLEEPAWLTAALRDPDPRVRIQALETWAQHPADSLDPVTYALVDPDESVRARAQELFEEALARR